MKIKFIIAIIVTNAYCTALERVVFKSLGYIKIQDKNPTFKEITPPENNNDQTINEGNRNYNEVEKYLKCMMCMCYPCFWLKSSKKRT